MALVPRIKLFFSFQLMFGLLASALVISPGQQQENALVRKGQSFPENVPEVKASACPRNNPYVANGTLIDQLWRQNCDVVARFLNNKFTTWQATTNNKTATLPSFQYYSAQDYYYLVETVQHKAFLMSSWLPQGYQLPSSINDTVEEMEGDLEYAQSFLQDIESKLSIPDSVINQGGLQADGLGYVKWLSESTELGRYAWQVARIACIYGWGELANQLNASPTTKKGTIFDTEWIQLNLDWSYGDEMSKEFQANIAYNNSLTFAAYNILFREGLRFEIAFFESAIGKTLADNKQ
ncbi:hypothetical protein F5Y14DRAFT_395473 [Nemania sp. NC0429]|nr:hypothetical protein F5Y14DRAFT_395473 [Nemania sp. NC0429]